MSDRQASALGDVTGFISPTTGGPLWYETPKILTDGNDRWPILSGIPYLRSGREEVRDQAVFHLRAGNTTDALVILLADRRDQHIPPADPDRVRNVTLAATCVSDAMKGLGYGEMAPYMLHRWCLPSYLSGLSLLSAYAPHAGTLFELGCGVGHYLRTWSRTRGPALGGDLIFSNLWLAKRFVVPAAGLVCFDAESPFPFAGITADVCLCQDALHYIQNKLQVVDELKRLCAHGPLLLGHVHNEAADNFSPGRPLTLDEYREVISPDMVLDDDALAAAAIIGNYGAQDCAGGTFSSAFAFVRSADGHRTPNWPSREDLMLAPRGTPLRLNPLLSDTCASEPGTKLYDEYVRHWDYLSSMRAPSDETLNAARSGSLEASDATRAHERLRVLLDLPKDWQ